MELGRLSGTVFEVDLETEPGEIEAGNVASFASSFGLSAFCPSGKKRSCASHPTGDDSHFRPSGCSFAWACRPCLGSLGSPSLTRLAFA